MGEAGMSREAWGPVRLEPVYKESVWAGDRLSRIRGLRQKGIGIAREICAYRGSENVVAAGEYAGKSIAELIRQFPQELMGRDDSGQLVRVAYIDAKEDLSVQVHPDQTLAQEKGDYEKSEAWYILEAGEGAQITAGVSTQDVNKLRQAAESGNMESFLVRYPVKAGDVALIPAGMVHACGGDMLALEVGSFGGITYRIYDYGRGRKLNLDEAFQVMKPELSCRVRHFQQKKPREIQSAIRHPLFSADIIDIKDNFAIPSDGSYYVLTCVAGECCILAEGRKEYLRYTETILIPAACGQVTVSGEARLLKSYRTPFAE